MSLPADTAEALKIRRLRVAGERLSPTGDGSPAAAGDPLEEIDAGY